MCVNKYTLDEFEDECEIQMELPQDLPTTSKYSGEDYIIETTEESSTTSSASNKKPSKKKLTDSNIENAFQDAVSSFKKICTNVTTTESKEPNPNEKFGDTVTCFLNAIRDEDNREQAKAAVLKYLADCVSEQFS